MENNYCIYRHIKPCGETFYIGIGNIKRPYEKKHRNNIWNKIIKKYPNYEIQILKKNISLDIAKELEIILIDFYGRKCNNTGVLCNLSAGGEGAFGYKHTEETKLRMSKNRKGLKPWNKNKKLSNEHKEKLKQNNGNSKKVINIISGEIYNSGAECARKNNYKYITLQQQLNGTKKNNTFFKFLKDYKNSDVFIFNVKKNKNIKKVLNLDNNIIYQSLTEAAICLNVKRTTLNAQISGQNKLKFNIKYLENE